MALQLLMDRCMENEMTVSLLQGIAVRQRRSLLGDIVMGALLALGLGAGVAAFTSSAPGLTAMATLPSPSSPAATVADATDEYGDGIPTWRIHERVDCPPAATARMARRGPGRARVASSSPIACKNM